ncbi:hypothetical protein AAFF_G00065450 [Aldrovandia affinis]|uniref:Uncharacterized protein n=1 Tax=Aldrovandia affinis TaxID=143900 RepID=A0AAD7T563_9TELE|nr:hypothetical protein AAFF_G00065450 [Aldrovandia affinis]
MQIKLDGQSVTSTMEVKFKVQALSSLRKIPKEIADSYLSYVQCLGSRSQKIIVVFDGYSSSPKDHDHIRHTNNFCCDLQI